MEPIYRKVFIKSEADLPEEGECRFFHDKNLKHLLWCHFTEQLKDDYLYTYDWYLRPVELPSDEEIEKAGNEYSEECFAIEDFFAGMKCLRDKLINK